MKNLSKTSWTVPGGLLILGIGIARVGEWLGLSNRREDEVTFTVVVLGVLLLAYPKLWRLRTFWITAAAWLVLHILLLWLIFDIWFPSMKYMSFWITLVVAMEVVSLQVLLNRWRLKVISEHRPRKN